MIKQHRAWGRSHISRATLGFCGQKPRWAAALVGCLLAYFLACAAQLWLAPGAGGASHSVLTRHSTARKK